MNYKEKVIALLNSKELSKEQKEKLEKIFPELKESEGERIRKWLEELIEAMPDNSIEFKELKRIDILHWIEKQGEVAYNPYKETVKSIANMCDKYATKMNNEEDANDFLQNVKVKCKDAIEFEKQGENKPTENVEIKFCEGDKVVSNHDGKVYTVGFAYHVTGDYICLHGTDGNHKWVNRDDLNRNYRLWTIADAKDGDIVYYECHGTKHLFIVKSVGETKDHVEGHFWYDITRNECEIWDGGLPYSNIASMYDAIPATKEQRDLLFQKMKEAGYEWNAEKKELRKMKEVNEDEMIKNDIIRVFKGEISFTSKETNEKYIAWLEKQGNKENEINKIKL